MTGRRLRAQGGFTLIEVLIVSSLFIVILGATLSIVASFDTATKDNTRVNEQIEMARTGLDRMNRQLRNLAQRVQQPVIDVATTTDFIFQTSDPAKTWVRYCLQAGTGPNGTSRLYGSENASSLSVTAGMRGPCPGTGWDRSTLVADNVTNLIGSRRVFSYVCAPDKGAACPATAADFPLIKGVSSQLFIDLDPLRAPREQLVSTAVHLRNQNEDPTAGFSWKPVGSRKVALNGAASSDPEGRTLRFYWYKNTAPAFTCVQGPPAEPSHWQGVTISYSFPASDGAAGTVVPFTVVVCDPGDLQARFTQGVTIPS